MVREAEASMGEETYVRSLQGHKGNFLGIGPNFETSGLCNESFAMGPL